MTWKINSAFHIGKEHEFRKTNYQDFLCTYEDEHISLGVVCDGCSEGQHSEFGAALIGTFVSQYLKQRHDIEKLEHKLICFLKDFVHNLELKDCISSVKFIGDYLLSTLVFCVIYKDENKIIICNSGDGVIIKDGNIITKEQNDRPHYLAYKLVPRELLSNPSEIEDLSIEQFSTDDFSKIVISSDGLKPFLEVVTNIEKLYNTKGRQLQRFINVLQVNERLFFDDISCIVFEK